MTSILLLLFWSIFSIFILLINIPLNEYEDKKLERQDTNVSLLNESKVENNISKIDNNNSLSYYVGDYTSSHTICFWIYPKSLSNQTILMIEQEFDDGDDTIIITALRLEIYNNKLRIRTYNTSTYNEIDNLNIDTWNYIGFNIMCFKFT